MKPLLNYLPLSRFPKWVSAKLKWVYLLLWREEKDYRFFDEKDAGFDWNDRYKLKYEDELTPEKAHEIKLKRLREKFRPQAKEPKHRNRVWEILIAGIISGYIGIGLYWFFPEIQTGPYWIQPLTLLIGAPAAFAVWRIRDENKIYDITNARKDTNLKEFQKLQEWATGNISAADTDTGKKSALSLQISALHQLRGYLKGAYGEDFRRPAFEIYCSALRAAHQQVLDRLTQEKQPAGENITTEDDDITFARDDIRKAIEADELARQLNRIVKEEWFCLLTDHNFPLTGISLLGADLSHTYLYGIQMPDADLRGANLQLAYLQLAYLQNANLERAMLRGADLLVADLQMADLQLAHLQLADLQLAHLQFANLQNAKLQNADLRRAILWQANLQQADLRRADLQNANLQRTDLKGANLEEVIYDKTTNFEGADLTGTLLEGKGLEKAKEKQADTGV